MKLALFALLAVTLVGCGVAYPPPKDATQEVVALFRIARELHDIYWVILILGLFGAFNK